MNRPMVWRIAALLILAAPVAAPATDVSIQLGTSQEEDNTIRTAWSLIQDKHPEEAVKLLDELIAAEEKAHAGFKGRLYSARSMEEAAIYSTLQMASDKGQEVLVLGEGWSTAWFMKGFALVDAKLPAEAGKALRHAVALAPMNAQFLGELAEWYKSAKDWPNAYDTFKQAADAAEFAPEALKASERHRAWRGMAYALSEQGKLDEAEALYRKCLTEDSNDGHAKSELEWIAQQRKKKATS